MIFHLLYLDPAPVHTAHKTFWNMVLDFLRKLKYSDQLWSNLRNSSCLVKLLINLKNRSKLSNSKLYFNNCKLSIISSTMIFGNPPRKTEKFATVLEEILNLNIIFLPIMSLRRTYPVSFFQKNKNYLLNQASKKSKR